MKRLPPDHPKRRAKREAFGGNIFLPSDITHRAAVDLPDGSMVWQWCHSAQEAQAWLDRYT